MALVVSFAFAGPPQKSPREIYAALNTLRVDSSKVYYVKDITLRRDVVRVVFSEGKLALFEAYDGRILGAVFSGQGVALAAPRDIAEKKSIARFLGEPIVDQPFTRAYLRFTDDTAGELQRILKDRRTPSTIEPSFAEEWNAAVINLNTAHTQRTLSDWLSASPRPYFYAGLLGEKVGPFDVLVDDRREESVILGQPKWVSGVRYFDVWASFARANAEPALRPISPLAYDVDTTIQPDRSLEGTTTAELNVLVDGERMILLELSRDLKVDSVLDDTGGSLVFFQNEEMSRKEVSDRGNDSLMIALTEPTRAGTSIRLKLHYKGTVISDAGNGVLFVGERGSWYPHVGGSDQFSSYDLKFRWPRKLELVATGKKLEEKEQGDWKMGRWKSQQPIPVAGFNLGNYARQSVDSGPVTIDLYANEDLEISVLRRFVRSQVPPTQPRSPFGRTAPPPAPVLPMPDAPPPSPAAVMKEVGLNIAEAIRFNEKLNGPFPFEKLSVAQIPGSFGQGWPGLLYLSTLSFLSPSQQSRAGIGQKTQEQFLELVPPHEVAHQWWGNLIGWSSYRDQWVTEGLANYIALLYADSKHPSDNALQSWLDSYRKDLTTEEEDSDSLVDDAGPLTHGNRLRSSKAPMGYVRVVYGKGAWVFHMLRAMLREPGAKNPDARFGKLLTSLLEDYRYKPVTTADLQKAVEKVMTPSMALEGGKSMDWFFDQYVRGTGIPKYSVDFTVKPQPDGTFQIKGKLKQAGVPSNFVAPVPLYLPRVSGKPVFLGRIITSGEETNFQFTARSAPKKLLIDPNFTLLATSE
ncbi:MAG: hypothetical protein HY046_05605 [Acidobacteria bacterium]|nr:hypothetical protein [Acidobacteriota bacterium]